jgi:hypothetical protein
MNKYLFFVNSLFMNIFIYSGPDMRGHKTFIFHIFLYALRAYALCASWKPGTTCLSTACLSATKINK